MQTLSYIDPATTALIWQLLAALFIGFGVVLAIWWSKITTFFKSLWVKIFGGQVAADTKQIIDDELADIEQVASDIEQVASDISSSLDD